MITSRTRERPSTVPARPRRSGLPGRTGFSLLEMLVASVVLAVGLVIVTESISSGLTASTRVDRQLFAGQLAADRLNRAAAGEYSALPQEGKSPLGGVEYHWRLQERRHEGGLRSLLCSVRWTSRGRQQTVTLGRQLPAGQEGEPTR